MKILKVVPITRGNRSGLHIEYETRKGRQSRDAFVGDQYSYSYKGGEPGRNGGKGVAIVRSFVLNPNDGTMTDIFVRGRGRERAVRVDRFCGSYFPYRVSAVPAKKGPTQMVLEDSALREEVRALRARVESLETFQARLEAELGPLKSAK